MIRRSFFRYFIALQILSIVTAAQGSSCSFSGDSVNATGIIPFRFDSQQDEWYASLTFNYTYGFMPRENASAPPVSAIRPVIDSYLSMPQGTRFEGCQWMLYSPDVSATGPGLNGCEGILSEACFDRLRTLVGGTTDIDCTTGPIPPEWHLDSSDVCGNAIFNRPTEDMPEVAALAFSFVWEQTCDASPPEMTLPEQPGTYSTLRGPPLIPRYIPIVDNTTEDFSAYDEWIGKTWIHAYTVSFDDSTDLEAQIVCLSTRNVTDGSRVPDGLPPPLEPPSTSTSAAAPPTETGAALRVDPEGSGSLVAVAAGVLGLVWML